VIREATIDDAAEICEIYNYYVLETPITFEEQAVTPNEMASRIQDTMPRLPWLICRDDRGLLAYCYARPWRPRAAYRHSVECTVYVRSGAAGKGIGSELYQALLPQLRERQFHAVIGGIALPNAASVRLHEKFGFEKVAHFKQVGYKFGRWIDVGYWQLLWGDASS
jgi:phosphinothricin acetyltransferase